MWNRFRRWVYDILSPCIHDVECMKRGTYAGWIPLAIMAASAIAKKFADKKAGDAKGKEEKRVGEANAQANFETQSDMFNNAEGSRQARAGFIGSQLKGARALSPELIAAITKAKANPARKGATIDPTKGSGWNFAGGLASTAGQMAADYMKGSGGEDGGGGTGAFSGGGAATSLRPASSGIGAGMFNAPTDCPPGKIC